MKRYILITIPFCLLVFSIQASNNDPCHYGYHGHIETEETQTIHADEADSEIQLSYDPNELIGPVGYDSLRWVSINDVLKYTVFFENDPDFATAPAQALDIRFQFPERQMQNSFSIGEYGFANQVFAEGIGGSFCRTRLDLRDSMNLYVDVLAGLDIEKMDAFWKFSSIDPTSGYSIYEADRGLLPVNDSTHVGEGFVTFSLRPAAFMQTGDTLSLMAKILFDQNDTIPTNRWCNRIDAGAPTTQVLAQHDTENSLLYHLSFAAQDDEGGCGVKQVILYAADYLGVWQEVGTYPADTTIDYLLEPGLSCPLMAIGEDHVGNREEFKAQPDMVLNDILPPAGLALSNTRFSDDLEINEYIATILTTDAKDGETFAYALEEGDGAIHNDYFTVIDDRLLLNESQRCTDNSEFRIRLSTTNSGGMTYSEAFTLTMDHVLFRPKTDTLPVALCEGDTFLFRDMSYTQAGTFPISVANDYMCDSTFLLMLTVLPKPQQPVISLLNDTVLVSSNATGNRWYYNGVLMEDAVEQQLVPMVPGEYTVVADNGYCQSRVSSGFTIQPTYFITVTSNNDTYGETFGTGEYAFREYANISAVANTGYRFVKWDDENEESSRSVLVGASNATYMAQFAEVENPTGITNSVASDWNAYCMGLTLYVEDAQRRTYYVWSGSGKLIYYGTSPSIDLPQAGAYLVKLGDITRKIVTGNKK